VEKKLPFGNGEKDWKNPDDKQVDLVVKKRLAKKEWEQAPDRMGEGGTLSSAKI